MLKITAVLALLLVFSLIKNNVTPRHLGVKEGKLAPCPWSDNCASSQSEDPHYAIEPLTLHHSQNLETIEAFFASHYTSTVVSKDAHYLHLIVATPMMHFKDDIEFFHVPNSKRVDVRSASRLGYSDMGKNRERIEALRAYLEKDKSSAQPRKS